MTDFKSAASLVHGTLIHFQEGVTSIENIKIGDCVLSQNNGATTFEQVSQALDFPACQLYFLSYDLNDEAGRRLDRDHLVCTSHLQVWVRRILEGDKWSEISSWMTIGSLYQKCDNSKDRLTVELELMEGRVGVLAYGRNFINPVLATASPKKGLVFYDHSGVWADELLGISLDFSKGYPAVCEDEYGRYVEEQMDLDDKDMYSFPEDSLEFRTRGFEALKMKALNVRVANGYGYYVGRLGLMTKGSG